MNQTFELSRWGKLVTLHWVENRKRYLLAIPAIAGLMLAWDSFVLIMDKSNPMETFYQYMTFYWGLYFVGCLYASMIFSQLGNQAQGIGYLGVPASHFEKLLCALLFSVVLFFLMYTLIFYLVDIPMVEVARHVIEKDHHRLMFNGYSASPLHVYNVFTGESGPIPDREKHIFLLAFFAIQSMYVLGSVYFPRYSFIKTTVVVLLLIFGYMILEIKILGSTLPTGWNVNLLMEWWEVSARPHERIVSLAPWAVGTIGFFVKFSLPLLIWVITYFRLKEKEV